MTSLVSIGNDAEGAVLISVEGRLFGLDAAGNEILNTYLASQQKPSRGGIPGQVGVNIPFNMLISNAQGVSSNLANVSFQVQDIFGNPIAGVFDFDMFLSDAASGAGLTATTASGGIAALAGAGAILGTLTTSKAVRAQTNAAGLFTLVITDTSKTAFYPCASLLPGFPVGVGAQLTTASYHS